MNAALLDEDPFGPAPAPQPKAAAKKRRAPEPQPDPQPYTGPIEFVIYGEPVSKANSRELALIGPKDKRRMLFRKSDKGLEYEKSALRQIPPKCRLQLTCPVKVTLRLFYATERPDLDESIVLDVLQSRFEKVKIPGRDEPAKVLIQAGVYLNDRQVREKHVYHGVDKLMPRAEIRVEKLDPQETLL